MNGEKSFSYYFSLSELRQLTLFMRSHEHELPVPLESFFSACESFLYNSMTIDEAESFFNET